MTQCEIFSIEVNGECETVGTFGLIMVSTQQARPGKQESDAQNFSFLVPATLAICESERGHNRVPLKYDTRKLNFNIKHIFLNQSV